MQLEELSNSEPAITEKKVAAADTDNNSSKSSPNVKIKKIDYRKKGKKRNNNSKGRTEKDGKVTASPVKPNNKKRKFSSKEEISQGT